MKPKSILYSPDPPWVLLSPITDEDQKWIPSFLYGSEDLRCLVRVVRGNKMRTLESLMTEFGSALQFFDGFGENWHALSDCLQCLDETYLDAEAFVILVTHADELLSDDGKDNVKWFFQTMVEVGDWWSKPITDNDRYNRPPRPFHVVLKYPDNKADIVEKKLVGLEIEFDTINPETIVVSEKPNLVN